MYNTKNKVYLASMIWSASDEPICVGKNKKKVKFAALKMLKTQYGTGPVNRGSAMCSRKITGDDILITEVSAI